MIDERSMMAPFHLIAALVVDIGFFAYDSFCAFGASFFPAHRIVSRHWHFLTVQNLFLYRDLYRVNNAI